MKGKKRNVIGFRTARSKKSRAQRLGKTLPARIGRRRGGGLLRPWFKVAVLLVVAIVVVAHREAGTMLRLTVMGAKKCEIVNVVDGDTVNAFCPGQGIAATRLLGFDTPEVFSPKCLSEHWAGIKATFALRRMIWTASESSLVFAGTDRYGRRLASLFLDGTNVSRLMINAGYARAYGGGRRSGWCE